MGFGSTNHIPPPGLQVRTVIGGVEQRTQPKEQQQPPQPPEEVMPRGVYERKPRNVEATPAEPKKHKRGRPPGGAARRSEYADVLADLRAKRAAIDAAIHAIESL